MSAPLAPRRFEKSPDAHRRGGNAQHQRLADALPVAFPVAHDEQLVLNDRALGLHAILILYERRPRHAGAVVEERVAVEFAVAQELIGRAVKFVASRREWPY